MGTAGFSFAIGRTGSNVLSFVATCEFGLVVTSACFLATGGAGLVVTSSICFFSAGGVVKTFRGFFFPDPRFFFSVYLGGVLLCCYSRGFPSSAPLQSLLFP